MPNEERRVRKSKKSIDDACWSLLRERDFSAITVGEIAQLADINRGTFYRHYADKYDWLERQIELLTEDLFSFPVLRDTDPERIGGKVVFAWFFRHFDAHFDIYAILFSEHTGLAFQNRFTEHLADFIRAETVRDPQSAESEFEVRYLAAAVTGLLKWWVTAGRPLPPERMAERMLELYQNLPWRKS